MNIVTQLKTLRIAKIMFRTMLRQKHRLISQVQRTEVISSDSTDNPSSDYGEMVNGLNHAKPMPRVFTLGKIHRALAEFTDDKGPPDQTTKRLLKGFYTQDRWELENDSEQESSKFSAQVDFGKIQDIVMQAKGFAGNGRSPKRGQKGEGKTAKVHADQKKNDEADKPDMGNSLSRGQNNDFIMSGPGPQ